MLSFGKDTNPQIASDEYQQFVAEHPNNEDRKNAENAYNAYLKQQDLSLPFPERMNALVATSKRNKKDPLINVVGWNKDRLKILFEWFQSQERDKEQVITILKLLNESEDGAMAYIYMILSRDITSRKNMRLVCRTLREVEDVLLTKWNFTPLRTYNGKFTFSKLCDRGLTITQNSVDKQLPTAFSIDTNLGVSFTLSDYTIFIPIDDIFYKLPIVAFMKQKGDVTTERDVISNRRSLIFNTRQNTCAFLNCDKNKPLYHYDAYVNLYFFSLSNKAHTNVNLTISLKHNNFDLDEKLLNPKLPKRKRYIESEDESSGTEQYCCTQQLSDDLRKDLTHAMLHNNILRRRKIEKVVLDLPIPANIALSYAAANCMLQKQKYVDGEDNYFSHITGIWQVCTLPWDNLQHVHDQEHSGAIVINDSDNQIYTNAFTSSSYGEVSFPSMFTHLPWGVLEDLGQNHKLVYVENNNIQEYVENTLDQDDSRAKWRIITSNEIIFARLISPGLLNRLKSNITATFFNNKLLPEAAILGHTWCFSRKKPQSRIEIEGFKSIREILEGKLSSMNAEAVMKEGTQLTIERDIYMGFALERFPENGCFLLRDKSGDWFCFPTNFLPTLWNDISEALGYRGFKW